MTWRADILSSTIYKLITAYLVMKLFKESQDSSVQKMDAGMMLACVSPQLDGVAGNCTNKATADEPGSTK